MTSVVHRPPAPEVLAVPSGRTVFLCIPSGTPAANLLRTRVFSLVRDDPSVRRIVILSPYSGEQRFVEEFGGPKIGFAELAPGVPGWLERRFIRVMQEKFVKTMPTESMRIRVARAELLEREQQRDPAAHRVPTEKVGVRPLESLALRSERAAPEIGSSDR